jgi:hypothetical protein
MNFIIWSDEEGPVRVEEANTFLKTYPIDASLPLGRRGNLIE